MNDEKEKEVRICVFMVFVLIFLLFFCSVAFGKVSDPLGGIYGTIYYSDGKPIALNDSVNATDLMVVNKDTNSSQVFTTNDSGYYNKKTPTNLETIPYMPVIKMLLLLVVILLLLVVLIYSWI